MAESCVHLFVATGRFGAFEEMRAYVEASYTEDGDCVPSEFMTEVGLEGYEPACIECVWRGGPTSLGVLLEGASFLDRWLASFDASRVADSAIACFSPNAPTHPERCSLEYLGAAKFHYRV